MSDEKKERAPRSRERGKGKNNHGPQRVSFSVSCTPEEMAAIKQKAAAAGKPVSRFILDSLL